MKLASIPDVIRYAKTNESRLSDREKEFVLSLFDLLQDQGELISLSFRQIKWIRGIERNLRKVDFIADVKPKSKLEELRQKKMQLLSDSRKRERRYRNARQSVVILGNKAMSNAIAPTAQLKKNESKRIKARIK